MAEIIIYGDDGNELGLRGFITSSRGQIPVRKSFHELPGALATRKGGIFCVF